MVKTHIRVIDKVYYYTGKIILSSLLLIGTSYIGANIASFIYELF